MSRSAGNHRQKAPFEAPQSRDHCTVVLIFVGGGTRSRRLRGAGNRSSASARRREFAATPPPMTRCRLPSTQAATALMTGTSATASENWLPRRRSERVRRRRHAAPPTCHRGLETAEREVVAIPLGVLGCRQTAGKEIAVASPLRAASSIGGPPGNGKPSSRATLSNASPAASSIVAPADARR